MGQDVDPGGGTSAAVVAFYADSAPPGLDSFVTEVQGELTDLLERAGGTADYRALGLGDEEMATAEEYGHYVRNRFTVMKLSRILGLLP